MTSVSDVRSAVIAGDLAAVRRLATGERMMVSERGGGLTGDISVMAMRALGGAGGEEVPTPAKRANQLACLRYLMQVYPVPKLDEMQRSAVQSAVASGCLDVVQEVVKVFPDVPLGRHEFNPFYEAVVTSRCDPATVEYVFEHANLTLKGGVKADRATLNADLLQFAIAHSNEALVRWLSASGVDVRAPVSVHAQFRFRFGDGPQGQRGYPIHFATSRKMVELLESLGATLDPEDRSINDGEGALFAAVRSTAPAHLKYLLGRGVRVDYVDHAGRTVLHCAAERSTFKEVEMLVAAGAAVNAKDSEGQTALMRSLITGQNAARYKALLKAGADVFARDNDGNHRLLALSEASVLETTVAHILKAVEQGMSVDSVAISDFACHLISKRHPNLALQLIECAAFDASAMGGYKSNPLHEAVKVFKKGGQDAVSLTSIVDAVLSKGFDLEARNGRDFTPLMEAVSNMNPIAVEKLLARGAEPHALAPAGKSGVSRHSMEHLTRNSEILAMLRACESTRAVDGGVLAGAAGLENAHGDDSISRSQGSLGML